MIDLLNTWIEISFHIQALQAATRYYLTVLCSQLLWKETLSLDINFCD